LLPNGLVGFEYGKTAPFGGAALSPAGELRRAKKIASRSRIHFLFVVLKERGD